MLPRPDWLLTSEPSGPAPATQVTDQAAQIRALYAAGKSFNALQVEVFGYRGGVAYAAVKAVLGDTQRLL